MKHMILLCHNMLYPLPSKKERGFKQINCVREDLKEEVRGITIQALIRQQHFNSKIVYKFTNCICSTKAKCDKSKGTLTKNCAFATVFCLRFGVL